MDWNDVRYFLALAREGSVRGAGGVLGVSHSTVARRIEALEGTLGARLFDRSRDGYQLTDAGRLMMPGAERIEGELAALEREVLGIDERLAGPVHVTCCDEFVGAIILRGFTALCARCPDIELRITADSRNFSLTQREADIAVRVLGRHASPPEHLMARKLVPVVLANFVGVAHADKLDPERVGTATRWLSGEDQRVTETLVARSSYPEVPVWGAFSTLGLMLNAARDGLGITMLPTYVGDPDPALRRLRQPDVAHLADMWLLCHPDLRTNARLQAARRCIQDALLAALPLFRGDQPQRSADGPLCLIGAPTE